MAFDSGDTEKLLELIDRFSMDKYYLNYNEFFSNHLGHGQVVLFRLGGSLELIDRFSRHYSTHLEPKGGPLNQKDDARLEAWSSIEELKGKGSHFYPILDFYKSILSTGTSVIKRILLYHSRLRVISDVSKQFRYGQGSML